MLVTFKLISRIAICTCNFSSGGLRGSLNIYEWIDHLCATVLTKLNRKERYSWLTADLDVFQDVGTGQCEGADVFGLSQVAVQTVGEVHHVVLGGVDLSEGGAQRAASTLKVGLLAAPLLLQLRLLLLHTSVPAQLGTLGAVVCIL